MKDIREKMRNVLLIIGFMTDLVLQMKLKNVFQ